MVFIIYFVLLLYIVCIPIVRHTVDGHRGDENMMAKKNNMWLNIVINMNLLVCHITGQDSFMHIYGTLKV